MVAWEDIWLSDLIAERDIPKEAKDQWLELFNDQTPIDSDFRVWEPNA